MRKDGFPIKVGNDGSRLDARVRDADTRVKS